MLMALFHFFGRTMRSDGLASPPGQFRSSKHHWVRQTARVINPPAHYSSFPASIRKMSAIKEREALLLSAVKAQVSVTRRNPSSGPGTGIVPTLLSRVSIRWVRRESRATVVWLGRVEIACVRPKSRFRHGGAGNGPQS